MRRATRPLYLLNEPSRNRREIFEAPDPILTYALGLIAGGRYLEGDDPFAENDKVPSAPSGIGTLWLIVLCTALIPVLSGLALGRRRKGERCS